MRVEDALTHRPVALVTAHPDDETVGAGGILPRMRVAALIQVTDGAPRNHPDREAYAETRRQELACAMEQVWGRARHLPLDLVDQEASLDMAALGCRLAAVFGDLRPAVVLTHPYEGGHPDHDATAYAVHAACAMVAAPPEIYEFTSYHQVPLASGSDETARDGAAIEVGRFLPYGDAGEVMALPAADRERKARMIACFTTQLEMLRHFPLDEERFRAAPAYDFTQPPHAGKLFYEYFEWGMTGERWRSLAAEAARAMGIPVTL